MPLFYLWLAGSIVVLVRRRMNGGSFRASPPADQTAITAPTEPLPAPPPLAPTEGDEAPPASTEGDKPPPPAPTEPERAVRPGKSSAKLGRLPPFRTPMSSKSLKSGSMKARSTSPVN